MVKFLPSTSQFLGRNGSKTSSHTEPFLFYLPGMFSFLFLLLEKEKKNGVFFFYFFFLLLSLRAPFTIY